MDGFFFITNNFDASLDPIAFVVHAWEPTDGTWKEIASSTYQAGHTDAQPGPHPVPLGRNAIMQYDMRPRSWGWIHLNIFNSLLIGMYLFTISFLGLFTYRQDLIYPMITSVYCADALLWLAACWDDDYNIAHFARAACVTYLAAGLTMRCGERFLWVFILELGVGLTLSSLYARSALWQGSALHETPNILLLYGVAMLAVLAYAADSYRRVLQRSRDLVLPDKQRQDAAWNALLDDATQRQALGKLEERVEEMVAEMQQRWIEREDRGGRAGSWQGPRQMSRRFRATDAFFANPVKYHMENLKLERCLETSLSHLFLTARFLHPLLLDKTKAWAEASGGMFRAADVESKPRFVKWKGASEAEKTQMLARFARLKTPSRAVAKAVRSYSGDVSQLVDICRQSIVFERVEHLVQALQAMGGDPEVRMERVKNRLAVEYDSFTGYRDVLVNLRLVNLSTRKTGADTHVCEVQLVMRPMAELKSDEGHRNYVAFRNFRSE